MSEPEKLSVEEALFLVKDALDAIRAVVNGERKKFIEEGWSEDAAEAMAMAVYGAILQSIYNPPIAHTKEV